MVLLRIVLSVVTVLAGLVAIPTPAATAAERDEVSLEDLMTKSLDGRDLRVRGELSSTSQYTRYAISYKGAGLRITGIMNVPRGRGPFPVVVLAHGYINPDTYWSGQGFRREQDALARNGYVALHVDYRNHAGSSNDPDNDLKMRLGYAEDVLNAAIAVRRSTLPYIDGDRIALLGRSMGGNVAFSAIAARPGVFDAAVVYASTSTKVVQNFNRFQRDPEDSSLRRAILRTYGSARENPGFWRGISAVNYVDRITEPVLMFHGTKDETCPVSWARATHKALLAADVDVRYVEYPNARHYMYGEWSDSMRRTLKFLEKHVAKA